MSQDQPLQGAQALALVEKLRDIPTLSTVVMNVMELVNNPKSTAGQIADVLKRDQVLTAKLLRTINSSFYNLSREIHDVSRALGFLGFNTVSAIVLGTSVFSSFDLQNASYFDVIGFWKHSLASAMAAELLAKKIRYAKPEEVFTCGLLHDVGKIALFQISNEDMKRVCEKALIDNISFLKAEMDLGLPGHAVMGEKLADQWKLPTLIKRVIRYHHRDAEEIESLSPQQKQVIMLVTLGNIIAKRLSLGKSADSLQPEYPQNYLKSLGLSHEALKEVEAVMPQEMERADGFLKASMS